MYEGSKDNPGRTNDDKVKACAKVCKDKSQKPFRGSWDGFTSKGFVVRSNGRCFCESSDSKTCKRTGKNGYKRYDFIDDKYEKEIKILTEKQRDILKKIDALKTKRDSVKKRRMLKELFRIYENIGKDIEKLRSGPKSTKKTPSEIKSKAKTTCNHKKHCLTKCKDYEGKLWCYLNKKSKGKCKIDGNKGKRYFGKSGSPWSYEPCESYLKEELAEVKIHNRYKNKTYKELSCLADKRCNCKLDKKNLYYKCLNNKGDRLTSYPYKYCTGKGKQIKCYNDFIDQTRNLGETCTHSNHCLRGYCKGRIECVDNVGKCTLGKKGDKILTTVKCGLFSIEAHLGKDYNKKFGKRCESLYAVNGVCQNKSKTKPNKQSLITRNSICDTREPASKRESCLNCKYGFFKSGFNDKCCTRKDKDENKCIQIKKNSGKISYELPLKHLCDKRKPAHKFDSCKNCKHGYKRMDLFNDKCCGKYHKGCKKM